MPNSKNKSDRPFDELTAVIGQRWLDDVFVLPPSSVPAHIYHYTDAAGLKGMIERSVLWATDHRFLNDRHELSHLRDAVCQVLTQECRDNKSQTVRDLCTIALKYSTVERKHDYFIFSMSERRDDLSQWRGYAREGRGFTIGLDGNKLIEAVDQLPFSCGLGRVEYDHRKQIDAIHRVIKDIDREVVKEIARGRMPYDEMIDDAARTLDAVVGVRAAISKHDSFSAESEWRIVALLTRKALERDVKVRTSGDRLVPYIEIDFDKPHFPLASIGVGPGFAGTHDVDAVRRLCAVNGHDPEIYFANTPYRRL